jgi:hypothetical protein
MAQEVGLWVIARHGPYINGTFFLHPTALLSWLYAHGTCQGETSAGGIPGRVTNIAGFLRSNDTDYYDSYQDYYRSATDIIRRHQVTKGGPIILVQVCCFPELVRLRGVAVLMWDCAGRQ